MIWFNLFDYFLDGSVRLVDGSSSSEGRVEVYYQGAWGTVCDDLFDIQDATVICRQLGFPSAVRAVSAAAEFSVGDGPIFLDNLECTGDESKLSDCTHTGWTVDYCDHSEDAGVICTPLPVFEGWFHSCLMSVERSFIVGWCHKMKFSYMMTSHVLVKGSIFWQKTITLITKAS